MVSHLINNFYGTEKLSRLDPSVFFLIGYAGYNNYESNGDADAERMSRFCGVFWKCGK